MRVRNCVEFEADFPLDWVEHEDDGGLVPGQGLLAAQEIAKVLTSLGCIMVGDVEDVPEHGCEFRCLFNGVDISVYSNYYHDRNYALSFSCNNRRFGIFGPSRDTWNKYGEAMVRIDAALRNDGRFENPRWFGFKEKSDNRAGHQSPIYGVY